MVVPTPTAMLLVVSTWFIYFSSYFRERLDSCCNLRFMYKSGACMCRRRRSIRIIERWKRTRFLPERKQTWLSRAFCLLHLNILRSRCFQASNILYWRISQVYWIVLCKKTKHIKNTPCPGRLWKAIEFSIWMSLQLFLSRLKHRRRRLHHRRSVMGFMFRRPAMNLLTISVVTRGRFRTLYFWTRV